MINLFFLLLFTILPSCTQKEVQIAETIVKDEVQLAEDIAKDVTQPDNTQKA